MKWLITMFLAFALAVTSVVAGPCDEIRKLDHVPGRVIVTLKDKKHRPDMERETRGKVVSKFKGMDRTFTLELPVGVDEKEVRKALKADSRVADVELDAIQSIDMRPSDGGYPMMWALPKIGMEQAWEMTQGHPSVIVAVLDTGITLQHRDLVANIWKNPGEIPFNNLDDDGNGFVDDVNGWDTLLEVGNPNDQNGHGTHVAGTIGATINDWDVVGIAPNVKLMAVRVLNGCGSGTTTDAIEGLQYAVQMGAHISNASFGSSQFIQAFYDAIAVSSATGHLLVAAAGNSARDTDAQPYYPQGYAVDSVMSVGASDQNDALATFSNWGATSVDLFAPGVSIFSTWAPNACTAISPNVLTNTIGGTSMAAPHVAGAAALVKSVHFDWTHQQIKPWLMSQADPIAAAQGKSVSGARLNVARAVGYVAPPDPGDPGVTCGNQDCEEGEDCYSCSADCVKKDRPRHRPIMHKCCGDGTRAPAEDATECDGNF